MRSRGRIWDRGRSRLTAHEKKGQKQGQGQGITAHEMQGQKLGQEEQQD
jgi:hypothetical protein